VPVFLGGKSSGKADKKLNKPTKVKRVPVTYRLPNGMKEAMLEAVVMRDKYGLKGKSRWIGEAVQDFLHEKSWKDQVLDVDMMKGKEEKDVVYLPELQKIELSDARTEVLTYLNQMCEQGIRQENLNKMTITVSSIIRAAIVWRLFDLRMPVIAVPEAIE